MKNFRFFLLLLLAIFLTVTGSAQNMFLKIKGIPGESKDEGHKDWINLLSFKQGVSAKVSTAATRMAGRANFNDFIFTKKMDKASPLLMEKCATGEMLPEVEMEITSADGRGFYTIRLNGVRITGVETSSNCIPQCVTMEEVSFNYSKITWEYTDAKEGKVKSGYDLMLNKKI